jgi:hypothetical protein
MSMVGLQRCLGKFVCESYREFNPVGCAVRTVNDGLYLITIVVLAHSLSVRTAHPTRKLSLSFRGL